MSFDHPQHGLGDYQYGVIDFETTGLHWWEDTAFACALTLDDDTSWAFNLRDLAQRDYCRRELPKLKLYYGHHIKFDIHFGREAGIKLDPYKARCTLIRAALIDEHRLTYDLDSVAGDYAEIHKESPWEELAGMFGGKATKDAQVKNLQYAPWELVEKYVKGDTIATKKLSGVQNFIIQTEELGNVDNLEHELLPVVVDMERRGVPVDLSRTEQAVTELGSKIYNQQQHLDRMAGFGVNVNPSNALKKLIAPVQKNGIWYAKDGTQLKDTPGGKACIDADALRAMTMPEAEQVLNIRLMRRTRETFLLGHILGHHNNGYIHATINQTKTDRDSGTGTGRFSITDPALQQIHKRNKDIAQVVRGCFIPDPGQEWNCTDWSQMDFRIFAHYSKDPSILNIYEENPDADFHQLVADLTGIPRERSHLTGGRNAKQINLGLVFGMGEGRMAQEMGLPFSREVNGKTGRAYLKPGYEAEELFSKYHKAIPGVRRFLKDAASVAKSRGYVVTYLGRRIRFPGGRYTHKAGGLIFQGTAADALKVKMIEVYDALKDTEARLMLTVHDEFNISQPCMRNGSSKRIQKIVTSFGTGDRIFLRVPIRASIGIGPNWWEASK